MKGIQVPNLFERQEVDLRLKSDFRLGVLLFSVRSEFFAQLLIAHLSIGQGLFESLH
jgi:hypothetical protein